MRRIHEQDRPQPFLVCTWCPHFRPGAIAVAFLGEEAQLDLEALDLWNKFPAAVPPNKST